MTRGEETRSRILTAAESVFAERGVASTSLRAITSEAGVNMAAVNYHFGSKEELALDVFREVARRANEKRIVLLNNLVGQAQIENQEVTVEEIIDCFIDPYLSDDDYKTGVLLAHLIIMRRFNAPKWSENIGTAQFDEMAAQYIDALHMASGLDWDVCYWRYYFMVSTVVSSVCDTTSTDRFLRLSGGLCDPSNRGTMRREMRTFLARAFDRSPP